MKIKIKMKKIISFFLIFAMLTSLSLGAFAETSTTVSVAENKEYENMLGLLETLGIIEDYDGFSETKAITRGYFAMVAARLFNTPFEGIAKEQHFTDVPAYSSYADAVELLVSRGIINGDGSGLFRENDRIKTIDALKMLVLISDYGFIADSNGGYPDGYIKAANVSGFIKGVGNLYDYVSYESMLTMLSNFLNAKSVKESYSPNKVEYTLDENEILLKTMFAVEMVEGVVTKNSYTAFNSVSDLPENYVEITTNSGKRVLYSKTAGEFIGKNVKAYYTKDYTEYGAENVILYAHPASGKNKVITLNIADVNLEQSNKNEIKYYIEGNKKLKKAAGVTNPTIIYNKVAYAEGTLNFYNVLGDKKGTIELIDNTGDGVYEVINITAYKSFVIGNILADEQKIYSRWDAYGKNTGNNYEIIDINPDHYDVFLMKDDSGKKIDILELVEKNIVSVAQTSPSAQKKIMEVIISNDIRSGKITDIEYDNNIPNKAYLVLDSQSKFPVLKEVIDNFDLKPGKTATLYIDALGNIVGAGSLSAGYFRYGMFLNCGKDFSGITIQLFTAENNVEELPLAKKSYIDGVKHTNKSSAWADLQSVIATQNSLKPNVTVDGFSYKLRNGAFIMRYMLNDEGEIYKIDTATADKSSSEDGGLVMGESGVYLSLYDYMLIKKQNGKTIPFSVDTTVLWVTLDDFEKSEYNDSSIEVLSAADLVSNYEERIVVTYSIKDNNDINNPYADLVLVMDSNGIDSSSNLFVVDKIKMGLDKETYTYLPCLVGIQQGTQKQILVSASYETEFNNLNLKQGDAIRCYYDSVTGYLNKAQLVSHYISDSEVTTSNLGTAPSSVTLSGKRWCWSGYVVERRGELLKIAHKAAGTYPLTTDTTSSNMMYAHPTASTSVIVYNKAERRVFIGSFDDIKDDLNHPGNASRVIVRYDSGSLKEIIVYNEE